MTHTFLRLSDYLFDENDTSFTPHDAARRDNHENWVEAILNHKGHYTNKKEMTFEVQWRGEAATTWEPWSNVRLTKQLHDFLRTHKMKSIIPKNLQAWRTSTFSRFYFPAQKVANPTVDGDFARGYRFLFFSQREGLLTDNQLLFLRHQ